jgi:hypothetical protein
MIARVARFILLLLFTGQVLAQEKDKPALFKDQQDGAADASEWLLERKGFLPIPIVITEPAVGYGLGIALTFFRGSIAEAAAKAKESGHVTPPDIYAVAFAATENGTKFGGAGGMVSFLDDRWRYRGGVGRADVNLDFYGAGGNLGTSDIKIGYNLDGWISSQQVLRRLGESDNFIGARWIYLDLAASFDPVLATPVLPPRSLSSRSSGLGLAFEHDSRDNIFTPSRGWKGSIDAMFYSPEIGSDNKFESYRAHVFAYLPVGKEFVFGGRLDGRAARGDVPFYQLPYIDLRGIPAARYQDDNVGVAEVELRWNATPRWAFVAFTGAGRAWGTNENFGDSDSVTSWGVGFRYLIARRLGFYMGVDIAKGPEDTAFYIQAGSAWR